MGFTMQKALTVLIIITFFIFLIPSYVFAESNFITNYNITYKILENAITNVAFDISLTNKTSQYYASSYGVQVGFKNIENVLAKDGNGIINPKLLKNNDGYEIQLTFTKAVTGQNKNNRIFISFDTPDIAQKSRNIWNINIPGLTRQNEFHTFNVNVIVPTSLGKPSYIKPFLRNMDNGKITFTKEELGKSGISMSFGNQEIYKFNLSYHLSNPTFFSIKKQIALPPSTNYQDIKIESIDPKPLNVIFDKDGNWLAKYKIGPSKTLNVNVEGLARISLHPKKEEVSQKELNLYLKDQPYWQTKDLDVENLAKKLKTPNAIYDYVVKTLKYDFSRVTSNKPRLGALEVLRNPGSAVCLEFTDLFIALARSAGIPARKIDGFAYTQNSKERPLSLVKDILHSWPEYYDYDLKTWVMVDPTWGNTTGGIDYFYTLDFDHFAFVKKGIDSTLPIAAGGYKLSRNEKKDVLVKWGEEFGNEHQTLSFTENFSKEYLSFTNVKGTVVVKNLGNIKSNPQALLVDSDSLTPHLQKIDFNEIPPFGFLEIPVNFQREGFLTNKTDAIKISIKENYITKDIRISPLVLNKWSIMGGVLFAIFSIAVSIVITKARNLPFFR